MWQIELGCYFSGQAVVMHVAHDTNDLILLGISRVLIYTKVNDAFANGIFIQEVALGERIVNDGGTHAATLIAFAEIATSEQRNSNGLKILRGNIAHMGRRLSSRFKDRTALDLEISSDVSPTERHRRDKRSVLNTG